MSNSKLFTATPRMVGGMEIRSIKPLPEEEMRKSFLENHADFIEQYGIKPDMSNLSEVVNKIKDDMDDMTDEEREAHRIIVPDEAHWLILLSEGDGPSGRPNEWYESIEMNLYAMNANPYRMCDDYNFRYGVPPEVQMTAVDALFRNGWEEDFQMLIRNIPTEELDMNVLKYATDILGLEAATDSSYRRGDFTKEQLDELQKHVEAKQNDITLTDADLAFADTITDELSQ